MKIKRFKLNAISAEGLQQKEMNAIVGGNTCNCGCAYANQPGGSSTYDNMNANYGSGYNSTNACNLVGRDDYYWEPICRPKAS